MTKETLYWTMEFIFVITLYLMVIAAVTFCI